MENRGLLMKYFVLKPSGESEYARAARITMLSYADAIRDTDPDLAADLICWVEREEGKSK